jgi:hypothetical protein
MVEVSRRRGRRRYNNVVSSLLMQAFMPAMGKQRFFNPSS